MYCTHSDPCCCLGAGKEKEPWLLLGMGAVAGLSGDGAEEFRRRAKHLKIHRASMIFGNCFAEWWHFVNLFCNL